MGWKKFTLKVQNKYFLIKETPILFDYFSMQLNQSQRFLDIFLILFVKNISLVFWACLNSFKSFFFRMLHFPYYITGNIKDLYHLYMAGVTAQIKGRDDSQPSAQNFLQIWLQSDNKTLQSREGNMRLFEQHIVSKSKNFKDGFQIQKGEIQFKEPDNPIQTDYNVQSYCSDRNPDPGQDQWAQVQDPVSSQFISIFQGNFENQQSTHYNQTNLGSSLMISQDFPQDQDGSEEESNSQRTHLSQSNAKNKRKNDANNAHKKIITALNKTISSIQRKFLKEHINKERNSLVNYVKASRYGFIQYLSIIKHFFGNDQISNLQIKFKKQLEGLAATVKKEKNSEAKDYLLSLPHFYKIAFGYFIQGSVEQATKTLYKMDRFKQETYMQQGVKHVMTLIKELEKLQA